MPAEFSPAHELLMGCAWGKLQAVLCSVGAASPGLGGCNAGRKPWVRGGSTQLPAGGEWEEWGKSAPVGNGAACPSCTLQPEKFCLIWCQPCPSVCQAARLPVTPRRPSATPCSTWPSAAPTTPGCSSAPRACPRSLPSAWTTGKASTSLPPSPGKK